MGFRLVPKLVTLNGLERRNGYFCVIFTSGRIIRKFSGGPYGEHGAQAYNGGVGQSLN